MGAEEIKEVVDLKKGEVVIPENKLKSTELIKQTKIKVIQILKPTDFALIKNTWEIKRDGALKILSSLPFDYTWEFEKEFTPFEFCDVKGVLTVDMNGTKRVIQSNGFCDKNDSMFKGQVDNHNMISKAETRALKRAIEVAVGGVINYFVLNVLQNQNQGGQK
jgi:hypothetical protein